MLESQKRFKSKSRVIVLNYPELESDSYVLNVASEDATIYKGKLIKQ